MSEFTYRSQQIDYLGFLEAQLRDLQGIDRLAYELIQNADDVQPTDEAPAPTRLSFDVTDEALVVENDGIFRTVDFQRLQSIASGGKRNEEATTGAFGLGFIAVYQITDTPHILSNQLHWIIHPEAPAERRIEERHASTTGTRFVLPWAFDSSSFVRRALRLPAVDPQALNAIAQDLGAAITLGALFLKQLNHLEVRRNGIPVRQLQRQKSGRRLDLAIEGEELLSYLLFEGDFRDAARRLRDEHSWQIEEKRNATVTLALPTTHLPQHGRLFAVLPTDSILPLPLFINADFFPTTDRRRIHFDEGYQARWNEQAILCAALVLAENLNALKRALPPRAFWALGQGAWQTEQAALRQELPACTAAFWHTLVPLLRSEAYVFTASGEWSAPSEVRIAAEGEHAILRTLNVTIVHPDLSPYYPLLRLPEIGVADLSLSDISTALHHQKMPAGITLDSLEAPWRSLDSWRKLWQMVDGRLRVSSPARREQQALALRHFHSIPLVLDERMTLAPLNRIFRGDEEARALFPELSWMNPILDEETFPGRFVPQFDVRQAVDRLAALSPEEMQQRWQMGRLDLPRLFRWFEARQIEIFADDPALQREIRHLPLVPISGELRPLAHLYIPGGFEDPLKLAAVADIEALGGRRQFLEDLGLQQLDFETYVHSHIPRVLEQNPDLPSDARHQLARLLAERLGHMRDDQELQQQLSRLPLIACMDGSFRAARDVYASRDMVDLLGPQVRIAEPPATEALQDLYNWLGVRREPATADLLKAVLDLSERQKSDHTPLSNAALSTLLQCWQYLEKRFQEAKLSDQHLGQLRAERTLPNRDRILSQPARLLFVDQPEKIDRYAAPVGVLDKFLLHQGFPLFALAKSSGLRPFSAAREIDVSGAAQSTPARAIEQRITQRRPLMARLLQTVAADEGQEDPLYFLSSLHVLHIPGLLVRRHLRLGSNDFYTDPEAQPAVYIAAQNTLYIDDARQPSWATIARELALRIGGGPAAAGLALGIREVLSAATYDKAADILDELGYP